MIKNREITKHNTTTILWERKEYRLDVTYTEYYSGFGTDINIKMINFGL